MKVISDIIITPVRILYAAAGTSVPADTVAAGGSWGGSWTELGYTLEPLSLSYEFEPKEIFIQESLAAVKRLKQKESLDIETTLAELDGTQLLFAWGGTLTATAAGSGQPGKEELTIGDTVTLTEREWGFEGSYIDEDGATFPVRIFVWKATASAGGKLEFGKENPAGIPFKLSALADMGKTAGQRLFKFSKILEPAT